MLEGYAAGNLVGSNFMGFERLRKKMNLKNADPSGILAEAFSQIEKAMLRPEDPCRTDWLRPLSSSTGPVYLASASR